MRRWRSVRDLDAIDRIALADIDTKHANSVFDMGSRRPEGVCQVRTVAQMSGSELSRWKLSICSMLPLVCNDAVAILFMFDLSRKSTL